MPAPEADSPTSQLQVKKEDSDWALFESLTRVRTSGTGPRATREVELIRPTAKPTPDAPSQQTLAAQRMSRVMQTVKSRRTNCDIELICPSSSSEPPSDPAQQAIIQDVPATDKVSARSEAALAQALVLTRAKEGARERDEEAMCSALGVRLRPVSTTQHDWLAQAMSFVGDEEDDTIKAVSKV